MTMSDPTPDRDEILATLREAANAARAYTLPRFRTALAVDNKWTTGFDPVTVADREAETAVREVIARRHPSHGVIGEEWDNVASESRHVWIVDPIDGTRAFISGVPVWGTLIGLMAEGRAVAGLMEQPFTGETWIGLPGGTIHDHSGVIVPARTSRETSLARARISATSPDQFLREDVAPAWQALRAATLQTRWGLDCYAYCLLASGHLEIVAESGLKDVDIAPMIPIVENAGGVVTTWTGGPAEGGGNVIASANPALHEAALRLLSAAL